MWCSTMYLEGMATTSKVDPQAVTLADALAKAAYQVTQVLTNREWLIHQGEDFAVILAAKKAAHQKAKTVYMAYKASQVE